MNEFIECLCDTQCLPLWGYCVDDLFCPLCGDRITRLESNQDFSRVDTPLLIYGETLEDESVPRFVFPLDLYHGNQDRSRIKRHPLITSGTLTANNWFKNEIAVDSVKAGFQFYARMVPRAELFPFRLPVAGLFSELRLKGDFGELEFPLCICNFPEIEVELKGKGIDLLKPFHWNVWRSEVLDVTFTLHSRTAPVVIDVDVLEITVLDEVAMEQGKQPVTALMQKPLRKGVRISPEQPWSTQISLDCSRFNSSGRSCQLLIDIRLKGIDSAEPLVLSLEYVDKGRIEFEPASLTIKQLYLGESRSNDKTESPEPTLVVPKWYITNAGKQEIRVDRPNVILNQNDASPIDWAYVDWSTDTDETCVQPAIDGSVTLPPGRHAAIYVRADLTRLTPSEIGDGKPLYVKVQVLDDNDFPWTGRIHVNGVRHRKKSPDPLAIDFGNSHSFAAMWTPDSLQWATEEEIVPVHDLIVPDAFPTAIYFDDVSNPDLPIYVIGHEAIERSAKNRDGLVTDLKRWIGQGGLHHQRTVIDSHGRDVRYDIATLVVFFLRALIHRSENVIRKYRVAELGLSYPATFGPRRRRALEQILARIQDDEHGPKLKLVADGMAIDEANAAIISYVLSRDFLKNHQDLLNRGSFIAASADWGGGSLDTAVLRFTVTNKQSYPRFKSEYLGIGGDEFFGGDNMTLAVMELLSEQLRLVLTDMLESEEDWDRLMARPDSRDSAPRIQKLNFDVLWSVAETVKRFQSNAWSTKASDEQILELKRSLISTFAERFNFSSLLMSDPHMAEKQLHGQAAIQKAIEEGRFLINIEAAWTHQLTTDFQGDGGYSMEQRFLGHMKQLREFAKNKSPSGSDEIDLLVLCGSGSRLPLVEKLVIAEFDEKRVVHVPQDAKRRVAHGVVRFLDAHKAGHDLARSKDYTNAAIGILLPAFRIINPIIPACSSVIDKSMRYPILDLDRNPESMVHYFESGQLILHRSQTPQPYRIGVFDLEAKPQSGKPLPEEALQSEDRERTSNSDLEATSAFPALTGYLKLNGTEKALELYAEFQGQSYGPWKFEAYDEDDE